MHTAKVISTEDPNQKFRVKIQLLPEAINLTDTENFPWASPLFGVSGENAMSVDFPEVGSIVWVLTDPYFKRFYWFNQYTIEAKISYATIVSLLSSVSGVSSTYGDIVCTLYEDQGLSFHNNNTGAHGFIHSNGSYMVFDDNGNLSINSGTTGTSGDFSINNGRFTLENSLGGNLKEILSDLATVLQHVITPLSFIGNMGAPVVYPQAGTDLSTILGIIANVTALLE